MEASAPGYLWSKYECFLTSGLLRYVKFHKLEHKTLTQCDADMNVDDLGDYNSPPCATYRRAKNKQLAIKNKQLAFSHKISSRLTINNLFKGSRLSTKSPAKIFSSA